MDIEYKIKGKKKLIIDFLRKKDKKKITRKVFSFKRRETF